jgi:endo-1,4-beta-xylanase
MAAPTSTSSDGFSNTSEVSNEAETNASTGGDVSVSNVEQESSDGADGQDAGATSEQQIDAGDVQEVGCPAAPALTGGQQYCSNVRANVGNGYGFELWAEGNGTGCMTVFGVGAAFKTEWNDVEDFLARVGLDFDETRTHEQIGNIWAEFAETQAGSEEGLTYVGIYGWTVDPLREFYILDDWGTTKPAGLASDGTPRDEVGVLDIDGETYDVWKKTRDNKPSIKGDATFDQYFSIRRTPRQCGRISVSEHFKGWEDLGLPFGKLYEVKLLVESQFNTGSVEFSSAEVNVD